MERLNLSALPQALTGCGGQRAHEKSCEGPERPGGLMSPFFPGTHAKLWEKQARLALRDS